MEPTKAQYFKEVVEQIFNRWTALKLCVEHGMGGKNGQQVRSNAPPNIANVQGN